jgi:hypothetical protein
MSPPSQPPHTPGRILFALADGKVAGGYPAEDPAPAPVQPREISFTAARRAAITTTLRRYTSTETASQPY